jgi:type IV secretion system protein VirB5
MLFKRSLQRYGRTPEAETPFQRAGQLWDERIGSARVQARNWRLMALGGLGLSAALAVGLIWQSQQSRVVPYIVAVDPLGEPRAIAPADKTYRPTDPQIAWFLSRFVSDVRSISLDPVLMRQNWLSAYDFATKRGALFLGEYARAADPFGHVGDRSVSVQVTSVVRASDRSFQVKWIETSYERGVQTGVAHWTGILTVVLKPPRNAEILRRNPLGLYVDAIDWSREIEPGVAPAPRRSLPSVVASGGASPSPDPTPIPTQSPDLETRP